MTLFDDDAVMSAPAEKPVPKAKTKAAADGEGDDTAVDEADFGSMFDDRDEE